MAAEKAPAPPDSLRVAFEGTCGATTWAVVHWFMCSSSGTPTAAELTALIEDIRDAFGEQLVHDTTFSDQLHLTRVRSSYTTQDGTLIKRTVVVADVTGQTSATPEPGQVACLINWATGDPRQGGKARSYLTGLYDGSVDDSAHLDTARVTAMTTAANAYIAAVNALSSGPIDNITFVEMSFRSGNTWRDTPAFYEIDSGFCSNVVATQRRRVDRLRT